MPYGVNNMVYPGAAMPNVLASMQGQQIFRGSRDDASDNDDDEWSASSDAGSRREPDLPKTEARRKEQGGCSCSQRAQSVVRCC